MTTTPSPTAALGQTLLAGAKSVVDSLINVLEADDPSSVALTIENDAWNVAVDFVPAIFRPEISAIVTPVIGKVEATINPEITAAWKNGLAIAKARLDALL